MTIRRAHIGSAQAVKSFAIATLTIFALATPTVAFAQPSDQPPGTSESSAIVGEAGALTPEQDRDLTALVGALSEADRSFDVDQAVSAGASAQSAADFTHILSASGWTIDGETPHESVSDIAVQVALSSTACTGKTGYIGFFGAFWQSALNSCLTDTVKAGIAAGGAGAGAIAAALAAGGVLPAAAIAGAVGAFLAAGVAVVHLCQTASYGVHAIYVNFFVTGNLGCWGQ